MTQRTSAVVEREISKLQEERDRLFAEEDAFRLMPLEKQVAITLHNNTCHFNHTDGCGWMYEFKNREHDWEGHAHKRFLMEANRVIKNLHTSAPGLTPDLYVSVIEAVTAK